MTARDTALGLLTGNFDPVLLLALLPMLNNRSARALSSLDDLGDAGRVAARADDVAALGRSPTRRAMVVGEANDFQYAIDLAKQHADWQVIGTRYGDGGDIQALLPGIAGVDNLALIDNVDARRLEYGSLTKDMRLDDIVFNAPRALAETWEYEVHGQLVRDFLESARNVLDPGGVVRISSSTGMPAGRYLQGLATGDLNSPLPSGYSFRGGRGAEIRGNRRGYPFLGDTDFGLET